jgi:aminoglycoside phosphotransferase (APT) family kinase protein
MDSLPQIQTPAQIQAQARLAQTLAVLQQIPDADPVKQLLYSTLHARHALDRLDKAIRRDLKRQKGAPDPLFFTPVGQAIHAQQHATRRQLGDLAKQYIGLGIEERQTRVIEDWANVILPFVTAFADDPDLALSRRQREKLPMVVERHLRLIERPEQ